MDITEKQLDELADRVCDRVMNKIAEQYEVDLAWAHNERKKDERSLNSRRRIVENITGIAGAVGFLALMGWLGHAIISTIIDLMNGG